MRGRGFATAVVLIAVGLAACGSGDRSVDIAARGPSPTLEEPAEVATTVTIAEPTTTAVALPASTTVRLPKVTVPRVTLPPLPTLPVTVPTTNPLPVPELFDARQGLGTPCDSATQQHPKGCFFFVYALTTTQGWTHRIYSDAPYRSPDLSTASACGTEHPHHNGTDLCHWYIGAVHDRQAGQVECFWATTVQGVVESAPSNRLCFSWTEQQPPPGT